MIPVNRGPAIKTQAMCPMRTAIAGTFSTGYVESREDYPGAQKIIPIALGVHARMASRA